MILEFRIFTIYEEEIFVKQYQSFLSLEQQDIIKNTIPSLIRVIKSYLSLKDVKAKSFSITGVGLHFYIYNEYIYIITTSIGTKYPIFQEFITKTNEIVKSILNLQPIFDLVSNSYFLNKLDKFKQQAEITLHSDQNQTLIVESSKITKEIRESLVDKSKNKYLIMGAGAAGKSSIISQFFENWDQEELLNIKPTVLSAIKQYNDEYTKESFIIRDLAGQSVYRKKHLEDPKNFENVRCLIFVIDVQNDKNSEAVQKYFIDILDKLVQFKESPHVSIFLHKFDPVIRESFSSQILFWIEWLEEIFEKESYNHLNLNFHLSSVQDNTAREALARTLLFTLPRWFLGQSIQNELIIKSANSLYPVFGQFHTVLTDLEQEEIKKEIFQTSYLFGLEVTNEIVSNWIKYMVKNAEFLKNFKILNDSTQVEIKVTEKENKINFCLRCPLKNELKTHPSVCEITHGLFKGVGQLIGFPNVKLVQSEIRDKSKECIIELSY